MFVKVHYRLILIFLLIFSADVWAQGGGSSNTFLIKNTNAGDTIYTGQIQVHTSILEFPLPDAQIKFTLIDTISQIPTLVFEGSTNNDGNLIIEKLPIFESYVGIADLKLRNKKSLIKITNNGTASDHGIQIKLSQHSPIQALILDVRGRTIDEILMVYNPFTDSHQGSWRGTHQKSGTYLFYAQTNTQAVVGKINHVSNQPGHISNFSVLKSGLNHLKASSSEKSKFKIEINSEVGETIEQTAYLSENESQNFNFSINHLPIADARIEGTVTMNRSVLAPNAKMEWFCLYSSDSFTIYTDSNGYYRKDDVPVPIDDYFTNPESTRYYLTVHIGDSITFKVDPVYLISGELKTENHNINIL